ncbi:MAG TPA: glycosyltransferase family 39 protein [Gemmatimonadota bacterium]|nr:glycosyltransferase family 39 protein [Gemmatimonadota bacterium]
MNRDPIVEAGHSRSPGSVRILGGVLVLSLIAGALVFSLMVRPEREPRWDEAAHGLQAVLVAHDVRERDFPALFFDVYRQVYWPPLHSLIVAVAFRLSGTSLQTVRGVSVMAFVLLAPVLFLVARGLQRRHGTLAGSVAAGLALTSPAFITYGGMAMLEALGALAIALTTLVYVRLERSHSPPRVYVLLGLCIVLTYLVKTNYGVLLMLALAVTRLYEVGFRPRGLLTRRNVFAVVPVAVFAVLWFAYPPKAVSTWTALVNQPWGGEEARGFRGLLFYPRAFIDLSGSWWMAILLWIGLFAAWRDRRSPGIAFLAILALIQFAIGEFHHTKVVRHIVPMFPAMFALAGVAAARLWSWAETRGRAPRLAAAALFAGVLVLQFATLTRRDWYPIEYPEGTEVRRYVSSLAVETQPILVLGTRESWPPPPVLDWHLVVEDRRLPVTASGSAMSPRQDSELTRLVAELPLPGPLRATALRVLGRYDASPGSRSLHLGDRFPEDRVRFARVLRRTLESGTPCAIVALIATSDTTRYTASFIAPAVAGVGFREVSVREFPRAVTRVHVYRPRTGVCR